MSVDPATDDPEGKRRQIERIMRRCRDDFQYYAERALRIITKPDQNGRSDVVAFKLNAAQRYIHKLIEEQRANTGMVRAIILKGRQQGASTYVEGRYYWKTSMFGGENTFILTHSSEATGNLFKMVQRYHRHVPPFIRPVVGTSNQKELVFSEIDSRYQVSTAGAKGTGRGSTQKNVHGSEVAFWENGEEHLKGLMQAVPLANGTEVILESTANGMNNIFYKQWVAAETGESDFIAIFVPWFWQDEYARPVPPDFEVNNDPETVPDGELTELEYQEMYKLSDEQIFWRRMKIIELGSGEEGFNAFKQEYPATADEAFQTSSGNSLISTKQVLKARKSTVATEGDLIIGVDPAGDGENSDATAIIRRRTRRLFDPQKFRKLSTMQVAATIHRIILKEKPKKVFIDVGGIGKGVYDRLMELTGTHGIVIAVNFGEAADEPETYINKRTEMAYQLKEWLDDPGGANIPDTDEIQGEFLATVPDDPDSNQRKRLKSKKWMRTQGIRSPDLFDAACLTFAMPIAAGNQQIGQSQVDFDPVMGDFSADMNIGNSYTDFDV